MKQSPVVDPELAVKLVAHSPEIAFDTETTGLTRRDVPCGYVITDADHTIYVPVRHSGGGNVPFPEVFEKALNLAFDHRARCGFKTYGHNLGFDLRMCNKLGVYPRYPLEDTMINESLINDLTRGYSLEECAERHRVTHKKGAELYREIAARFGGLPDRSSMKHFSKMPGDNPLVVEYAATDGVSTIELRNSQQRFLDEEELRRAWQLECRLIQYVARMHERGVRVDEEYAGQVMRIIADNLEKLNAQFQKGFNTRSPKSVEALYRANGYTDQMFAKTDGGKPSFTEKWLERNEIGLAILGVRRMEKARDSFVKPLIETENVNGRVHPVLNQSKSDDYGVLGSRFSCSEPNLQAFPRRMKEIGKLIRRLVIADDGMELAEADFVQQEPRFFAHYSQDPALVEGFKDPNFKLHKRASELLNLDYDTAKRMSMGMLTMMSVNTLAGHMGWGYAKAQAAHRAFLMDAFPKIADFQRKAIQVFKDRGYVKSILGRRARLEHPQFGYQGVSRIIQNSGGDHCKTALLSACLYEDAHPEVNILLTIHDSVIWQRPMGYDDSELTRELADAARKIGLSVPIPVEVGRGRDWATATYNEKILAA